MSSPILSDRYEKGEGEMTDVYRVALPPIPFKFLDRDYSENNGKYPLRLE
jgi:hypothetical protein